VVSEGPGSAAVREGQSCKLVSVFGAVQVTRTAYSGRGLAALHPVDVDLNLPDGLYSHEVQRQVALAAARTSFDATVETVVRTTGAHVPKRQAEALVRHVAHDFAVFYADTGFAVDASTSDLLVLSVDGKAGDADAGLHPRAGLPGENLVFAIRPLRNSSSSWSRKAS
jgi:hypothetical protein